MPMWNVWLKLCRKWNYFILFLATFPIFCILPIFPRTSRKWRYAELSMSMEHPSLVKVTASDATQFRNKKLSADVGKLISILSSFTIHYSCYVFFCFILGSEQLDNSIICILISRRCYLMYWFMLNVCLFTIVVTNWRKTFFRMLLFTLYPYNELNNKQLHPIL